MGWLVIVEIFVISDQNSDFDHMLGLVNGFCDQKPERSEMNWPNIRKEK